MKIGTSSSILLGACALLLSSCGPEAISFDRPRYAVGDRGLLRFWMAQQCGFQATCWPSSGMYLDSDYLEYSTKVYTAANADVRTQLPQLAFASSNEARFTIRGLECKSYWAAVEDPLGPCPVEEPRIYAADLHLHSEGRADLIAYDEDGNVYDRISVRVSPPLCGPDSWDGGCYP
jgi:hypothetical protein